MRRHPRRDWHPGGGCSTLHHAGTHVGSGRADAAPQTAQIEIAGSQIGSKVAAAVMGGVEQTATDEIECSLTRK